MHSKWVELMERQAGAATSGQLDDAGLTRGQRRQLVQAGVLAGRGRGLYLLQGRQEDWECRLWLSLLGAGDRAFICRRSAAALWGLDAVPPGAVDVAVGAGRHPRRPGIARLASVTPGDITCLQGMPVTTAARTLIDLGSVADAAIMERAMESGLRKHLFSVGELAEQASRVPFAGGRQLARVLERRPVGAPPTESDAETLFVLLARSVGLPDPVRQFTVILRGRKYRLDFAWPALRLAVEIDGTGVHGSDRLNADLHRQNQIVLDAWMIVRFTWQMLVGRSALVERDLRAAWELRSLTAAWR